VAGSRSSAQVRSKFLSFPSVSISASISVYPWQGFGCGSVVPRLRACVVDFALYFPVFMKK
jgi:hypothetical protein